MLESWKTKKLCAMFFATLGIVLLPNAAPADAQKVILGSFQGKLTEGREVGALCWAILSSNDNSAKKFCYFGVSGGRDKAWTWRRSDDKDFAAKLQNGTADEAIARWANEAGVAIGAAHRNVIEAVLAGTRIPSAEELKQNLEQVSNPIPPWVQSIDPRNETIKEPLAGVEQIKAKAAQSLDAWSKSDKQEKPVTKPDKSKEPAAVSASPETTSPGESQILKEIGSLKSIAENIFFVLLTFLLLPFAAFILLGGIAIALLARMKEERASAKAAARAVADHTQLEEMRAETDRMRSILEACASGLERIPLKDLAPIANWADADFTSYVGSKCNVIANRIGRLDEATVLYQGQGYKPGEVLGAAKESVELLENMRGWLAAPGDAGRFDFAAARATLSSFVAEIEGLAENQNRQYGDLPSTPRNNLIVIQDRLVKGQEAQEALQGEVDRLRTQLGDVSGALEEIRQQQGKALELLEKVTKSSSRELCQRVTLLVQMVDGASQQVRTLLPGAPELIDEAVESLAQAYRKVVESQEIYVQLFSAFCTYLHLSNEGLEGPDGLREKITRLQSETDGPHRPLRLGLAAALANWREGVDRLRRTGRRDVLEALGLESTAPELRTFLGRIELASDGALATELENGFSQNWFHELFRIEALLETYFDGVEPVSILREAVKQASGAVRVALQHYDWRVQPIDLLAHEPVPPELESRIERRNGVPIELRRVPEVRAKVVPHLESNGKNMFVDVRSFVWFKGDEPKWHFDVVGITPAEWRE